MWGSSLSDVVLKIVCFFTTYRVYWGTRYYAFLKLVYFGVVLLQ